MYEVNAKGNHCDEDMCDILSFVLKVPPRPILLLLYNSGFFDVSNLYISLLWCWQYYSQLAFCEFSEKS